jgi:hypothetical protein
MSLAGTCLKMVDVTQDLVGPEHVTDAIAIHAPVITFSCELHGLAGKLQSLLNASNLARNRMFLNAPSLLTRKS